MYQMNGDLIIETASSKSEAITFFNEIGPLHIERWGSGYGESGFANPYFKTFHHNLIDKCWDNGAVELLKIRVGKRVIARFYNFIYRNKVYFYLSGLVTEIDSKLKPGLTGHSLCIQKYIDDGYDYYDFMGGDERYKSNLSDKYQHLVKISLQKRKFKFILEKMGRNIKSIIFTTEKDASK
jgi:CelD/BcsL family acetyltransferase involved in cellulose biosynthesis